MSLRTFVVPAALAAVVVIGAIGPPAAPAAPPKAVCKSPGAIRAGTKQSLLTWVTRRWPMGWYGCAEGRRARYLGFPGDDDEITRPLLAGPYVAFRVRQCSRYARVCFSFVERRDLRTNRSWRAKVVAYGEPGFNGEEVSRIVLSAGGTIAWTEASNAGVAVKQLVGPEQIAVLDSGAIDRASLALTADGVRLFWMKDGVPRTSPAT